MNLREVSSQRDVSDLFRQAEAMSGAERFPMGLAWGEVFSVD